MLLLPLILCLLVVNGGTTQEPHCSRFHYEDQLLDKMIRLEIKVESMEKTISDTNKQVLDTNDKVKETLDGLKSDSADFKSDYNDLKAKIMDETKRIKDMLLTPSVSFKARRPIDISLETGQTVVFSETMMNHGTAYDNITGIFTTPVAGTYMFTDHLCCTAGKLFYYGIVSVNAIQTSRAFYEDSRTVCHSADAMLVLGAGQKIWLKCLYGSTTNVLYEYDSASYNFWNTFSGVLIHK